MLVAGRQSPLYSTAVKYALLVSLPPVESSIQPVFLPRYYISFILLFDSVNIFKVMCSVVKGTAVGFCFFSCFPRSQKKLGHLSRLPGIFLGNGLCGFFQGGEISGTCWPNYLCIGLLFFVPCWLTHRQTFRHS